MATWDGWQAQFLRAAGILVTPPNVDFLTGWARHATHPRCGNNPIDLAHPNAGSGDCAPGQGIEPHTQHYSTHARAADAFRFQVRADWAKPLFDALDSGNPFQIGKGLEDKVVSVLYSWGSSDWAGAYDAQFSGAASSGGASHKAGIMGGWHHLRRSLNRNWGRALHQGEGSLHSALRSLSHSRRVRL